MKLPAKEFLVSALALRPDPNGQVEHPYEPTLSYARPIYKDGKARGVLLVEVIAVVFAGRQVPGGRTDTMGEHSDSRGGDAEGRAGTFQRHETIHEW